MPLRKTKAHFIEPMLLLRTEKLPEEADWLYEIKLDGLGNLDLRSITVWLCQTIILARVFMLLI
jgi:hypothetical protein